MAAVGIKKNPEKSISYAGDQYAAIKLGLSMFAYLAKYCTNARR